MVVGEVVIAEDPVRPLADEFLLGVVLVVPGGLEGMGEEQQVRYRHNPPDPGSKHGHLACHGSFSAYRDANDRKDLVCEESPVAGNGIRLLRFADRGWRTVGITFSGATLLFSSSVFPRGGRPGGIVAGVLAAQTPRWRNW